MSTRNASRITILTAITTFVALSVVSIGIWAFTRPTPPAQAAAAPAEAAMVPPASNEETFERIELAEFKKLYESNSIVVLDVRSIEQYDASHIPNALQIPVARVEGEIPYLPKDKLIVTYCTCPNEESSGEAAMILARGGIRAKALLGGLAAWTNAGFPVQTGLK